MILYILKFYEYFLNLSKSRIFDRMEYKVDIKRWEEIVKKVFNLFLKVL